MARIRTIKPEFFTSQDIVELEPLARLLYIALWCEADKEGRLVWKPKTFKMRYLPGDKCDVESLCDSLVDAGLVHLYGDGFAYIPSFVRHQHINPRESVSTLPIPEDYPASLPKKVTGTVRSDVFERDGHACVRCGATEKLTLDHILPQSTGGPHIHENLRVMCRSCNSARPVSGQALIDDLASDGFTIASLRAKFGIDASGRAVTREDQELTHREERKGKEGKGKEGKGKEGYSDAASAPAQNFDLVPVKTEKPAKQEKPSPSPLNTETWQSYADAFFERYKTEPVRNAKTNSQIKQLVERLGCDAPHVASWFVHNCNASWNVKTMHSLDGLLSHAEAFRTQWATNNAVTDHQARSVDRMGDVSRRIDQFYDPNEVI